MKNGWTGGQYSLIRAVFGTYLFVHFVQLAPWAAEVFSNQGLLPDGRDSPLLYLFPNFLALYDGPVFVTAVLIVAAGLSVLFAIGYWDRVAAVALWYIWACLHGRMPLISNPGLPYVGWLLLAHAFLPPAPYGSWAARGRADPGNDWRMPEGIFLVAWILMALGYTYSGYTKLISPSWQDGTAIARVLENPLARPGLVRDALLTLPPGVLCLATWGALLAELSFAPLALVPRLRPWLWGMMVLMHLSLIVLIDFADLSLGMLMLHLFTFDPGWIRPLPAAGPALVFFDGHCGLCHRSVRLILAEDRAGNAFRFAPLDSETFRTAIPEASRAQLPDSLVVLTAEGSILTRSRGVRYILERLGGLWRVIGVLARLVPVRFLDRAYDGLAAVRLRLFPRPAEACPLVPKHLRERFAVAADTK
jgi:predicted DCC family thiol-disulfide oxidoreductase YuxK